MKPNKFRVGIVSVLLVLGTYATSNMAYAEDKGHEDRHGAARHADNDELARGIPHAVTLSNLSNMPLREIDISFSGKDSKDFRQQNNCGEKLAGKASCTINVTFMPRSPGAKSATMRVHTSGGDKAIYLTGTGI